MDLRERVKDFSSDLLLRHCYADRNEYTPEALAIMEEEIARRGIGEEEKNAVLSAGTETGEKKYRSDEFDAFDHTFSQTDILLVSAMLTDEKVPFFVDNPASSSALPVELEAGRTFTIHVHRDFMARAHELVDQHFDKANGVYALKELRLKERLKLINFNDMRLNAAQLHEKVDVQFADEEKRVIVAYGRRLLDEVDALEEKLERPIFYYDVTDDLIARLQERRDPAVTVADLLNVLEILQVFCDEEGFPTTLDDTIGGLLDFFESMGDA